MSAILCAAFIPYCLSLLFSMCPVPNRKSEPRFPSRLQKRVSRRFRVSANCAQVTAILQRAHRHLYSLRRKGKPAHTQTKRESIGAPQRRNTPQYPSNSYIFGWFEVGSPTEIQPCVHIALLFKRHRNTGRALTYSFICRVS